MNAIVLKETGGPEVLQPGTADDPVAGPGEVVVELRAAALNRRDIFVRKGIAPSPLPIILGSDGAGVIRSLGDGVRGVAEGDEVIVFPSLGWGGAEAAPAPGFRILGGPDDGTYAELVRLPAENVFPRPSRLSWEECAALPLAGLTAWRALVSRAGMRPGETVLILGIG
ncbi:MAG: zinc-binding alcohol dehydrogenase/oxidoreductase, partial [Miltoncostaeaceae bacterium]|nr:zinc-binding alcohol dehydrogenase/oxidoreductase [Miltoncostaeaceae bacterium]